MRRDLPCIGAALAVLAGLGAAGPASAELATAQPLTYTGAQQVYSVPLGVTWLGISAAGAPGWNTTAGDSVPVGANNGGLEVSGALPVFAGEQLFAEVGQAGQASGAAAFGGGGAGGTGSLSNGGSGGGASDVRYCSTTAASCPGGINSLQSRLIVAGGGGGSGGAATATGGSADYIDPLGGSTCVLGAASSCVTEGLAPSGGTVVEGGGAAHGFATQNPGWTGAAGGSLAGGTPGVIPSTTGFFGQPACALAGSAAGATGAVGVGAAGGSGNANGGGGGGGGYAGGGSGASGRVASGTCSSPAPSGIAGGGGAGSSFVSSLVVNGALVASGTGTGVLPAGITLQPLIQLLSPMNGATYAPGQVVDAAYDCYYGSAAATSCGGTVASGTPIDTSTPGQHTFTVANAWASGVSPVVTTVAYTVGSPAVKPTGAATISGVGTRHPKLLLTVFGGSGSGQLTSVAVAPSAGVRFVGGLKHGVTASHGATAQLSHGALLVKLNAPASSLALAFSKSAIRISKRLSSASFGVLVIQSGGIATRLLIKASVS